MPVTSVAHDPSALTMTVVADFVATPEAVWNAYVDPRKLERFWGPPTWPSTFTRHDVVPGGLSTYFMTGPDGEVSRGFWEFLIVDEHRAIEIVEGFLREDGDRDHDMPTMRMRFDFSATEAGARVTTVTHFNDLDELERLLAMGMEEGLKQAMGQIDDVLADLRTFAADIATHTQILSDTQVRISRVIRGPLELVWRAHHEPDLMKQWLLGPDGWTMPVCVIADEIGGAYRYEWEKGDDRFGFEGELLESNPPHRVVTSERPIGMPPEAGAINELTLTEVAGGTLLSLVITYSSAEVRDIVLATGMTDGMEVSYVRLEEAVIPALV